MSPETEFALKIICLIGIAVSTAVALGLVHLGTKK